MRRLSGWDTIHLQVETLRQVSNVLGLVHLERVADPVAVASELSKAIRESVSHMTPLQQIVRQVPWDPDLPVWVESPGFCVDDHVISHEVSGFDEIRRYAEILAARRLDRRRPLWAVHIFRDVTAGEIYVIWLMHHCVIDAPLGKSMLALVSGAVDVSTAGAIAAHFRESEMTRSEIVRDGFRRRGQKLRRLPRLLVRTLAMLGDWVSKSGAGTGLPLLFTGRRTSLNTTMDDSRHLDFMQVELAALQNTAKQLGCTINDILLSALAGAMRSELLRRGDRVDRPHTVMQPNVVDYGEENFVTDGANTVSAMISRLRTDVGDVRERLYATHAETIACKEHHAALGTNWVRAWSEYTVRFVLPAVVRMFEISKVSEWTPPIFNVLCANVDGTDIPAVFFGHKVRALYPIGALYHGTGLSVSAWSTGDSLNISFLTSGASHLDTQQFTAEMRSHFDLIFAESRR